MWSMWDVVCKLPSFISYLSSQPWALILSFFQECEKIDRYEFRASMGQVLGWDKGMDKTVPGQPVPWGAPACKSQLCLVYHLWLSVSSWRWWLWSSLRSYSAQKILSSWVDALEANRVIFWLYFLWPSAWPGRVWAGGGGVWNGTIDQDLARLKEA